MSERLSTLVRTVEHAATCADDALAAIQILLEPNTYAGPLTDQQREFLMIAAGRLHWALDTVREKEPALFPRLRNSSATEARRY